MRGARHATDRTRLARKSAEKQANTYLSQKDRLSEHKSRVLLPSSHLHTHQGEEWMDGGRFVTGHEYRGADRPRQVSPRLGLLLKVISMYLIGQRGFGR